MISSSLYLTQCIILNPLQNTGQIVILPAPAADLRLLNRVLLDESEDRGFRAPSSYNLATCLSIVVT